MTVAEIAQQWSKRFPRLSPGRVMEEFLPLLGEAWEAKKTLFSNTDKEDFITNTLSASITQQIHSYVQQGRRIPWGIYPQVSIVSECADGTGKIIGRCDLIITLGGNREYIHECKRLWPEGKKRTFTTSARLYVQEGLIRFLQPSGEHPTLHAQYNTWQGFAGMIGYVMDGRTSEACAAIRKSVVDHAPTQEVTDSCLAPCPAEGSLQLRSTHQDCTGKNIQAHHLLLGLPEKA